MQYQTAFIILSIIFLLYFINIITKSYIFLNSPGKLLLFTDETIIIFLSVIHLMLVFLFYFLYTEINENAIYQTAQTKI